METLPTPAAQSGPSLLLPQELPAITWALHLRFPVSHLLLQIFRFVVLPTLYLLVQPYNPKPTLCSLPYCFSLLPSQKFFILMYPPMNRKYSPALSEHPLLPGATQPLLTLHRAYCYFRLPRTCCRPANLWCSSFPTALSWAMASVNLPTKSHLSSTSFSWQDLQKHKH